GELGGEQGAGGEVVGTVGDETGAVGGVLDRVVEQQGLGGVVAVGELAAGEQFGDRDRGQGGQTGAEEAGALVGVAHGAAVVLGVSEGLGVVAHVDVHEHAVQFVGVVGVDVGLGEGAHVRAGGGQHPHRAVGGALGGFLAGGVHERA